MFNKIKKINYILIFTICLIGYSLPVLAQDQSRPKLTEIILNDTNRDKNAERIIRTFYDNWIKKNRTDDEVGEIKARFIPIAKEGSSAKFIYGIMYGEDFGGCYNMGCRTVIFHSKAQNQWVGVFNAFITSAFYDVNSRETKNANLIVSSKMDNANPGVWMWNGTGYELVNKK